MTTNQPITPFIARFAQRLPDTTTQTPSYNADPQTTQGLADDTPTDALNQARTGTITKVTNETTDDQ